MMAEQFSVLAEAPDPPLHALALALAAEFGPVVGHFHPGPPLLLDLFNGGAIIRDQVELARPWSAHEIALRMLNNLLRSYAERGDLRRALRACDMRLELPATAELHELHRSERA